jgi:membrane protein insertase Oxa1/YidC/SpoIIIJ
MPQSVRNFWLPRFRNSKVKFLFSANSLQGREVRSHAKSVAIAAAVAALKKKKKKAKMMMKLKMKRAPKVEGMNVVVDFLDSYFTFVWLLD